MRGVEGRCSKRETSRMRGEMVEAVAGFETTPGGPEGCRAIKATNGSEINESVWPTAGGTTRSACYSTGYASLETVALPW